MGVQEKPDTSQITVRGILHFECELQRKTARLLADLAMALGNLSEEAASNNERPSPNL